MNNELILLKSILNEEPCSQIDKFVISKAYELRHTVSEYSRLIERFSSKDVEIRIPWLDTDRRFGPYERFVLHEIIARDRNPMIFRSGTGSGKSSLFSYLTTIFNMASEAERISNWPELPEITEFAHIHDLNTSYMSNAAQMTLEEQKKACKDAIEEIAHHFFMNYFIDLTKNFPISFVAELVQTMIIDPPERYKGAALANSVISSMRSVFIDPANRELFDRAEQDQFDFKSVSFVLFNGMRTPEEKIAFSFLMINSFMVKVRKAFNIDIPLLLIIDNLDALPPYVQLYVIDTLSKIFLRNDEAFEGLRVITVMRLSSATDLIGARPDPEVFTAHHAPDPLEILYIRLTEFIITYDQHSKFTSLPESDRQNIFSKVLFLWNMLRNPNSEFSITLRALAGTNIRLCFRYAISWLLLHVVPREFLVQDFEKFADIIKLHLVESLVSDICLSSVQSALCEVDVQSDWSKGKLDGTLSQLAQSVTDTIFYWANLFINKEKIEGPRIVISLTASDLLKTLPTDSLKQCEQDVAQSILFRLQKILSPDFICDPGILKEWKGNCLQDLEGDFTKTEIEIISPLIDAIERIFMIVSKEVANWSKQHHLLKKPERIGRAMDSKLLTSRSRYLTYRSFYDCTKGLFDPLSKSPESFDLRPVNVFSADNRDFSPVALRILYKISEGRNSKGANSIAYSEIRVDVAEYLFCDASRSSVYTGNDKLIDAVLAEMIRSDRRLIFSGVHDEKNGIADWNKDKSRRIALSWTGIRVYQQLIQQPSYIQWAFDEIGILGEEIGPETVASVGTTRLLGVYKCFEHCLQRELQTYQNLWEHRRGMGLDEDLLRKGFASSLDYTAPMFDIFLRAQEGLLDSILNALRAAISSARSEHEKIVALETASETLDLAVCLEEVYSKAYAELFVCENERWAEDMFHSRGGRRPIRRLIEKRFPKNA